MGYTDETLPILFVVIECAYLIPHLHIYSDLLITKRVNIQRTVWATVTKLGYVGTSEIKYYTCTLLSQIGIFNTSFPYLF